MMETENTAVVQNISEKQAFRGEGVSDQDVCDLSVRAGEILLENGAELFRVEDTIRRINRAYGIRSSRDFVLSNGIFLTAGSDDEGYYARVQHIPLSSSHLDRVAAVNQLSREITEGRHTVPEANAILDRIRQMPEKGKMAADSGFRRRKRCFLYPLFGNISGYVGDFFVRRDPLPAFDVSASPPDVQDRAQYPLRNGGLGLLGSFLEAGTGGKPLGDHHRFDHSVGAGTGVYHRDPRPLERRLYRRVGADIGRASDDLFDRARRRDHDVGDSRADRRNASRIREGRR